MLLLRALSAAAAAALAAAVDEEGRPPPGPPPNMALTCAAGSAEARLAFCQRSLGFDARTEDLVGRLNQSEQVNMFFSYPGTQYIPRFNVKTWSLDHTCIHVRPPPSPARPAPPTMLRAYQQGVNKASGVTVFPHAIAQGASWDVDLVRRVSNATAIEARILSEQAYVKTHGASAGGVLSCDGGPLANSAHDPRWYAQLSSASSQSLTETAAQGPHLRDVRRGPPAHPDHRSRRDERAAESAASAWRQAGGCLLRHPPGHAPLHRLPRR